MERKLIELANLVEKLNDQIIKARESNAISAIETDIMLHLLRECYVVTEQLKNTESASDKTKSPYVAPVVQVIQESRDVQLDKTEEIATPQPEPVKEISTPQPVAVQEIPTPQPEPVQEFKTSQPEPIENGSIPKPDNDSQTMLPIEEIPVMSFAQVEVPHDIKPELKSERDESSTTNIYSAVSSQAPITPAPVESVKSDYQSHTGSYSNETAPETQAPLSPSHLHTQNSTFIKKQDSPAPMKTARQTGDLFGSQTIADKLKKETPSLIDKINEGRADQTLAHKMQLNPINDLKTAIGINEKFQFVNDLFEGRIDLYNDAISRLNGCGSSFTADSIMDEYMAAHGWKSSTEAYLKFKTFITRRYL